MDEGADENSPKNMEPVLTREQVSAKKLVEALEMMKKELSNSSVDADQQKIYGGTKELASTYLTKEMMYDLLLELLTQADQELQRQGSPGSIFNFTIISITVGKNTKIGRENIGGSARPQALARQLRNLMHPLYLRSISDAIPKQAENILSKIKRMGVDKTFEKDIKTLREEVSIAQQDAETKRTKARATALFYLQKLKQKSRERIANEYMKGRIARAKAAEAVVASQERKNETLRQAARNWAARGRAAAAARAEAEARAAEERKKKEQLEAALLKEKPFFTKKGEQIKNLFNGTFFTSPNPDVDPLRASGSTGQTSYADRVDEAYKQMEYTLNGMNGTLKEGEIYGVNVPDDTPKIQEKAKKSLKEFYELVEKNKRDVKEYTNKIYEIKGKIQREAEAAAAEARKELDAKLIQINRWGDKTFSLGKDKAKETIKELVNDYNKKLASIKSDYKRREPELKDALAKVKESISTGLNVGLEQIKNSFMALAAVASAVINQITSILPGGSASSFANWPEAINYIFEGIRYLLGGAKDAIITLAKGTLEFLGYVAVGIKTVFEELKTLFDKAWEWAKNFFGDLKELGKAFLKWWKENEMTNQLRTLLGSVISQGLQAFGLVVKAYSMEFVRAAQGTYVLLQEAFRISLVWLNWVFDKLRGGWRGDETRVPMGPRAGGMVWPDPTSEEESSPPIYRRKPFGWPAARTDLDTLFRDVDRDGSIERLGYLPQRRAVESYGLLPTRRDQSFGRTPESILKKKLQNVGINITKLTKTGKRLSLTRKELEERAMIFTKLQIKAKKLGIKLMYNSQTGRRYKSYKTLYNEVERNTISKMSTKELQTKLKTVGIPITHVIQGRRQYIPRKELERRALIFKQLQIKAKKLGIKLTYTYNGKNKHKSYQRLLTDISKK